MSRRSRVIVEPPYDPEVLDEHKTSDARAEIQFSDGAYFTCPFDNFRDKYFASHVTDEDVKNCIRDLAMTGENRTPLLKDNDGVHEWIGCEEVSDRGDPIKEPVVEERPSKRRKTSDPAPPVIDPATKTPDGAVRAYAPLFTIMRAVYAFGAKTPVSPANPYDIRQHPHELHSPWRTQLAEGCIAEPEWDGELTAKMSSGADNEIGRNYMAANMRYYCPPTGRIVVPIVCSNANPLDVFEMVALTAQTVLKIDHRRTWIFAVSFEIEHVYMWLFTRNFVVKTEPINWVKDPTGLIRIFLTLAMSSPQQLGLDPYVHRLRGVYDFIYEVHPDHQGTEGSRAHAETSTHSIKPPSRFYKHVESIVAPGLICLTGRTTRITKVVEVHSLDDPTPIIEGKFAILKDLWLNPGVSSEVEIQERMFDAVDAFVSQPDWKSDRRFKDFDAKMMDRLEYLFTDKRYRNLFLTKLHAWKGAECAPLSDEAYIVPRYFRQKQVYQRPINEDLYIAKHQSRVIYAEVCTRLSNLATLGDVMDIIGQTTTALQVLFCAGWVHRDISSGNVMAYRASEADPWAVKLADFEFATEFSGADDHPYSYVPHKKIGTKMFIPIEMADGEFMFQKRRIHKSESQRKPRFWETQSTLAEQLRATGRAVKPLSAFKAFDSGFLPPDELDLFLKEPNLIPEDADFSKIPPHRSGVRGVRVVHNYQHDLESLWWLALYFVAVKVGYTPANAISHRIFYVTSSVTRHYMLTMGYPHEDAYYRDKHDSWPFHPDLKGSVFDVIKTTRKRMVRDTFLRPIMGQLSVPSSYSAVHAVFATQFDHLKARGEGAEWALMKIQ